MLAGLLRVREFAWFQYKNGILDEAALRSYLAPLSRWFQRGDTMTVWREFSTEFDPEFVAYVEQMLRDSTAKAAVGYLSFHFARSSSIARPCFVLTLIQSFGRPRR